MPLNELMYKGLLGRYLETAGVAPPVFVLLMLTGVLVCVAAPYLLGSLNFGIIISKKLYSDDVRKHGSGNAGMTNMLRTYGKKAAVLTFLGDAIKAVAAAVIGRLVLGEMGAYIAGLMCIVGHAFPLYYKFKGGKGVVTTAVMVLMLNPMIFAILLVVFVVLVASTKYISLGSVMCMMLYPVLLNRIAGPGFSNIIAIMIAAFVIFLHRENIKRLSSGTESKISFKKNGDKDKKDKK
jgi:acyl-phosphate glycerol 3-phosphate acyltransferase